jgi:hypothetical protein
MRINVRAKRAMAALMMGCMFMPQALWAQQAVDDSPNEFAMVGDLLVARPIGAVMTVGGAAVWLVSLPFTLMAGHASEAAETLMLGPAQATFYRCLGCRNVGYTGKDIAQNERNAEKAMAEEQAELDEKYPYVGPSDFP